MPEMTPSLVVDHEAGHPSRLIESDISDYISRSIESLRDAGNLPTSVEGQIARLGDYVNQQLGEHQLTDQGRERILTTLFETAGNTLCVDGCLLLAERATFPQDQEDFPTFREDGASPQRPVALAAATRFLIALMPRVQEQHASSVMVFAGRLLGAEGLPLRESEALIELVASGRWEALNSSLLRFLALSNNHCPPRLLEEAAWDPDSRWRDIAVLNPNCPEHVRVAIALLRK